MLSAVDPSARALLEQLLPQWQALLHLDLIGVYLFGSLVTGDFDEVSDIDLMVVTESDLTAAQFHALDHMQQQAVQRLPEWEHRLEVVYLSRRALRTFRTERSTIAVISPGEPFHFKEAGNDWLINWYLVRAKGLTLLGQAATTIIEPISTDEYLAAVRQQVLEWRDWVQTVRDSLPGQGYAILTMCRALYACMHGEQASKRQAAEWATEQYPAWAAAIRDAWHWRKTWREISDDPHVHFPRTQQFVLFAIEQIDSGFPAITPP